MSPAQQIREAAIHLAIFVVAFPPILLLAFVARWGALPNFFPL